MALINWTEISVEDMFGDNPLYILFKSIFADKIHTHTKSQITDFSHTHSTWTDKTSDINNTYITNFEVNTDIKLCVLKYYRTGYNFTSTSEVELHTGLIPQDYRPTFTTIGSSYNPKIGIALNNVGSIFVISEETGSKTINATFWWHY